VKMRDLFSKKALRDPREAASYGGFQGLFSRVLCRRQPCGGFLS